MDDNVVITLERFVDTLRRMSSWHRVDIEHGSRSSEYALEIGQRLTGEYKLQGIQLVYLDYASLIHDLGRVAISDVLLSKPGPLTISQMAAMRAHSRIGYDMVKDSGMPKEIIDAIHHHHEHWDGSGYPMQLKTDTIPIFARIICIADMWDALTSDRPYRKALKNDIAFGVMNEFHYWFDPYIYKIFMEILHNKNQRRDW